MIFHSICIYDVHWIVSAILEVHQTNRKFSDYTFLIEVFIMEAFF